MTKSNINGFLSKLKVKHVVAGALVLFFLWMINDYHNDYYIDEMSVKNMRQQEKINLNELFHIGGCLLVEAGKRIVKIRNDRYKNLDLNQRKPKDNSIVTIADIESHNILANTLKFKYRKLSIESEENDSKNLSTDIVDSSYLLEKCDNYIQTSSDKWEPIENVNIYIDPLDATQEYSGLRGKLALVQFISRIYKKSFF